MSVIDLAEVVEEFRSSQTGQQLHDCKEASGRCKPAALALLALMHERGMTDAQLLNFQRRHAHEEHYVVRFGDVVIDPSARQFHEHRDADVPFVVPYDEFASRWDPEPLRVDFDDEWGLRIHKLDFVPEWKAAREGLPARPPGFVRTPAVKPPGGGIV
jgi:hypothetical protein